MEDEQVRQVASLRAGQGPGTRAKHRIDRLTALAVRLTGADAAALSIIEDGDIRLVGHCGLDGLGSADVTSTTAFCTRTVDAKTPVLIEDVQTNPEFRDVPLVAHAPHVQRYVGVPILGETGEALGTVCLLFTDRLPRPVPAPGKADLLKDLETLAHLAVDDVDMLRRAREAARLEERTRRLRVEKQHLDSHARHLEERIALATAAAGVCIWDWDIERGRLGDMGPLLSQLGYTPAQIPADFQPLDVLIHPDDRAGAEAAMRRHLAGEDRVYEQEFRLRARDGTYRWFLARGRVSERRADGQPRRFLGTKTDVTVLVERRQSLVRDLAEAREKSRFKSDFLAHMSHELRTPLNGVLGMAQVLLTDPSLGPLQKDYLNVIKDSGRNLLTLVNDLLDISLIETGGLRLEGAPFDLGDLITKASAMWRPIAGAKSLELSLDLAGLTHNRLHGDEERVRQVLMNIVSNAIKFTKAGRVCVSVYQEELEDGVVECTITVTDTGIGMSRKEQERLFNLQHDDVSLNRSLGGTGLGLAIARGLVEAMGGEIGAESTEGQGSSFWFVVRLPKIDEDDEDEDEDTIAGPRADDGRLRILVAEDAPDNLAVMRAVLQAIYGRTRVAITEVSTGIEAVGSVIDHEFDLVLMDVRMPGMDGLEATRRIRNLDTPKCSIPIIAITAHAMKGDKEKYIRGGMNDYISKPIDAKLLIEKIERITGSMSV